MRNVLVTGGAGFIGSHLVESLVRRGDHVKVVDDLSAGKESNLASVRGDIEFVRGDLREPSVVARAVQNVELIYHEAALASVPRSVEFPLDTHSHCATATLMLLDHARRAGVQRLVFAASSSAYGDTPQPAKQETDLPQTLSPYAAAKLASEYYCQAFFHSYGFETVCLRYFNVFGPRQDPASPYSAVIPLFITAMINQRRPTIFGDGRQSRDFVYVSNVVDANLLAGEVPQAAGKTLNVGIGRSFSLIDLVDSLNRLLGTKVEPEFKPPRPGDVRDSLSDISKTRSVLGYQPRVDLEEGLRRTLEYYRSTTSNTSL